MERRLARRAAQRRADLNATIVLMALFIALVWATINTAFNMLDSHVCQRASQAVAVQMGCDR